MCQRSVQGDKREWALGTGHCELRLHRSPPHSPFAALGQYPWEVGCRTYKKAYYNRLAWVRYEAGFIWSRTFEMVRAGLHCSLRMSRQMLPWAFTFGWYTFVLKFTLGGLKG